MRVTERLRVLMAKPGIDGHWRGAMMVSVALRDAGMEVIYAGNQTPREIAEIALQEDVDVVGLSILAASHMKLIPETMRRLKEKGLEVLVLVGGTIPREDIPLLTKAGVHEVFLPGTPLEEIVQYVRKHAHARK